MLQTPRRSSLRRLRQRRRTTTHQLEEMYYLVLDMKEDIAEELEQRKKEEKDKEEKNKPKESLFVKKFSFGQTVMAAWIVSVPLSVFWLKVFWSYLH
jgi:glycogen debranching enzyme